MITPTAIGIQPEEDTAISDTVSTMTAALQQVATGEPSNHVEQVGRPQRAKKPPDKLSYKTLGNPS